MPVATMIGRSLPVTNSAGGLQPPSDALADPRAIPSVLAAVLVAILRAAARAAALDPKKVVLVAMLSTSSWRMVVDL